MSNSSSLTNIIMIKLLFLAFLLSIASSFLIADENISTWIDKTTTQLNQIEQKLKNHNLSQGTDENDIKTLSQIQGRAQKCIDTTKQNLEDANKNLKALGDPVLGEPRDVANKRQNLKKQVNDLKNKINSCQLILIQSDGLSQKLKAQFNKEINQKLFTRTIPFTDVVNELVSAANTQKLFSLDKINWKIYLNKGFIALITFSLLIAILIRQLLLRHLLPKNSKTNDDFESFALALRTCLISFLPLIVTLLALLIYLIISPNLPNRDVSLHIVNSLIVTLGIYLIIRTILTPCKPAHQFLLDSDSLAKLLSHNLTIMLLILWIGYLILKTPVKDLFDSNLLYFIRAVLLGGLVLIMSTVLWRVRGYKFALLPNWFRIGIVVVLLASLSAELLGYRNLSFFLIIGTMGTLISFGVAIILNKIFIDFFDQLDNGSQAWQLKIRKTLNVNDGESIPGLLWIRFLVMLIIWGGFVFITLRSWGLSQQSELLLVEGFSQGFDIGSFHVVPISILFAIFVFSLVVGLSRVFQKKIAEPWINHTHLDRGARDAILTLMGYVGFILAALFALSIAGINFKNLAVIAGALSVGIGFGLQNIVNNFVSGLILLFERPIRSGDWIEVGDTSGYVKSINIRSTEIQTFDRADVIVPNSELISGQVTNWMLHDKIGRLKLSIGVAYGSDVEKVHDILMDIINNHPDVITNSHVITPPRVLFLEFGDSALNFELRFFLKDISRKRVVTSEVNFAIDKAFRQADIEIPFPQRDIHIRKDN